MLTEAERERRRRALGEVIAGERTQSDVAREFGVTRQSVSQWMQVFRETGRVTRARRRGKFPGLADSDEQRLREVVQNKLPSDFKIESEDNRWHWLELHDLVERTHRRRLPRAACMKLLRSFGVSDPDISIERKRSLRRHDHFDPNPVSSDESDELRTLLEAAKARLAQEAAAPRASSPSPRGRAAKKLSPKARARVKQKRKRQRKQRKRNR